MQAASSCELKGWRVVFDTTPLCMANKLLAQNRLEHNTCSRHLLSVWPSADLQSAAEKRYGPGRSSCKLLANDIGQCRFAQPPVGRRQW